MSNYFQRIEGSYDLNINSEKITVIRADAKFTTKNGFNLINMNSEFVIAIRKTAKELSEILRTIVYVQSDEINIIFLDNIIINNQIGKKKTRKINSYITQLIFEIFNKNFSKNSTIYFDVKTFGIDNNKLFSYLNYRFIYCKNYFITQVLKQNNVPNNLTIKKTNQQREDILREKYNINTNDYDLYLRMGCIYLFGIELNVNDDFSSKLNDYISSTENEEMYLYVDYF